MKKITVSKTASKGYAVGPAFVVKRQEIQIDRGNIPEDQKESEVQRFQKAVEKTAGILEGLSSESPIFEAHIEIARDIALHEAVMNKIQGGLHAEAALDDTAGEFISLFESMQDEYMRERAADLKDVRHRILCALQGIDPNPFEGLSVPSVIVAEELTPSDTANMDFKKVLGFLSEAGGVTSHVSIIAKSRGIPCITGAKGILSEVNDGMIIAMDARSGEVYLEPEEAVLKEYTEKQKQFKEHEQMLEKASLLPSVTEDGCTFMLCANVGNIEDIEHALSCNAEGIGLFRTEFLYMEKNDFPSEEEQFEVYKKAAVLCGEKELTIRTLDIGGDKALNYFHLDKEENPFLGYRAIRICLKQPAIFKAQLRALLRASAFGNIRIMYPMLMSMEELTAANALMAECRQELKAEGKAFNENIEVGMMIETPASVLLADDFASEVDFFSIGTNDLTQYMLAVDRGNEKISELYNSFNPAVVRAIACVIEKAHEHGIKVGMCGEFAGDPKASGLLLGLGLDEFSMSAGSIADTKYHLRNCSYQKASELAKKAVKMKTADEILELYEEQ